MRMLDCDGLTALHEASDAGDREMVAALHLAGFTVTEVTMQDIQSGGATLDAFRGVVFVGGFSFADTCGSAKGWAGAVVMNETALEQFQRFKGRADTFSLGICNGCQLMGLLGWVGETGTCTEAKAAKKAKKEEYDISHAVFSHNDSGTCP